MPAASPRWSELLDALASSDEAVIKLLAELVERGDDPAATALEQMKLRRQRTASVEGALAVAKRVYLVKETADAVDLLVDGVRKLSGRNEVYLWLAADGRECLVPGGGRSNLDGRQLALPGDVALMHRAARTRKPFGISGGAMVPLDRVSAPHGVAIPMISLQNFIGVLALDGGTDQTLDTARVQSLTLACELAAPALAALICKFVSGRQQLDPLTNLLGRRRFTPDLHRACLHSIRTGEPLALLFIDLDHFKEVNDKFGHRAGDEVLQTVATLLRETIRLHDSAYRYGGDELCVIAPGISGSDAVRLAERICNTVATHFEKNANGPKMTTSIGVADFNASTMPAAKDFTEAADRAVYEAKRGGRNRAEIAGRAGTPAAKP